VRLDRATIFPAPILRDGSSLRGEFMTLGHRLTGGLGFIAACLFALSAHAAGPFGFDTFNRSALTGGASGATAGRNATVGTNAATAAIRRTAAFNGYSWPTEQEPNNTPATANLLALNNGAAVVQGTIMAGDTDFFQFTGNAGDRIYSAVITAHNASVNNDSQLSLIASDGTTVIEFDNDDGSFTSLSSSIAGATLPTTGTYYLKVNQGLATETLRPYRLYVQVRSGTPQPEAESNDTPGTANAITMIPATTSGMRGGWVSGARNPAAATEQDWFSMTLNAGDTVYLSLDLDPERDNVQWNGRLGLALFGDASNQILVVDDASTGSAANPLSETFVMTVKDAGTYFAFVDSASPATGGPTATYHLNITIIPRPTQAGVCTTYTSTDVPKTIGPGNTMVSSTITIPGNPIIEHMTVAVNLNHAILNQVDAHLRSPAGNNNGLFTDIGAAAAGGQTMLDVVFDDDAAIPPAFTAFKGTRLAPEINYRLGWFKGENAGGTWTLDLHDDVNDANGGTLNGWSIEVCEPPPPPVCAAGFTPVTVFSTDFEAGAAGFTHGGTGDQWALGLPATAATSTTNPVADFTTCMSGVNCWKTNLSGTYAINSSQDLLSPAINLAGLSAPIIVNWAHRYQMESATFDHYSVDVQQVGGATPVRVFEWLDATMTDGPGNPAIQTPASAGWARMSARADSLAGLNTEIKFHLDSDNTVNFGGVAIDDVSVTACRAMSADLSITKTDGVTTATPGGSVTYTITASNAGPDPVTGVTVADTFPAILTATWTCVGAGGGTCTAAGSGNINDTMVNLPAGGSVTYTVNAAISASATGTLSNTATVSSTIADPTPANNSATDTDTLTPSADLSITKTDGVTTAAPGGSVTYTITASNAGPSNAPGATVADTFPASLTCTWTCVGAGGGTCTASGSGNISDTVNLPAGGSTTYTASCTISAAATGTLSNTATVAAPGGVTDPTPGNNAATDSDTLAPQADLSITKTDGVTAVTPGGSVTYTITASNAGPSNATGATVADTFPAVLTGVTWTCVGAGGGTCTASGSGNINNTVNLPAGGSVTYTVSATVSAAATGTLSNTATVAAPAGVTDPNPGNNSATDTDSITASANLGVTVTDAPDPVTSGSNITYTITASNAGPSDAVGATVSFPLDANTTFVSVTAPAGVSCTNPGVGVTGTVTCSFTGNFTVAASPVAITVVANVNPAFGGTASATATISATTADPVPGNNTATATTTVNTVTYAVTAVASPVAGGSITCASPVAHGATSTCTATANAGYSLTNISGCGGTPSATSPYTTGPVTAACTVTATFVINAITVTGAVSNSGGTITCVSPVIPGNTTTCTIVPAPGNFISSVSGCGGTPGSSSLYTTGPITAACTVTAAFGVLAVPTLNDGLLAATMLMLALAGWGVARRRRV